MNIRKEVLEEGKTYHIFNRSNAKVNVFNETVDFEYFIQLLERYILPVANIYAWAILNNHYHLVLELKSDMVYRWTKKNLPKGENIWETEPINEFNRKNKKPVIASHMGHMINSYARYFNTKFNRTGGLFERPYKRIVINDEYHLKNEIIYVSTNAVKHGIVSSIYDWKWSSIEELLLGDNNFCDREYVVYLFSDVDNLRYMLENKIWDRDDLMDVD